MNIVWVRIKSWHASESRSDRGLYTVCGRFTFSSTISETLPAEKSCESCLRIVGRRADR